MANRNLEKVASVELLRADSIATQMKGRMGTQVLDLHPMIAGKSLFSNHEIESTWITDQNSPAELEVGDAIDFWRVVQADKEAGHLILYAEMHLPGEGWLEFEIRDKSLYQRVVFRPRGVWGRVYWYSLLPFHTLIFDKMVKRLAGSV